MHKKQNYHKSYSKTYIFAVNFLNMVISFEIQYKQTYYCKSIQDVKKDMLQGLVVGRWVQCYHILLINLCSKTLRLRDSISEMWRRTQAVWTTKARKGVKETIEILSVNTILFTYRRCSIWPPPTSLHFVYRLIMSCQTLGKILDISWMTRAANLLYLCHNILLSLHGSLVHQGFHVHPEIEIQWCQVS